MKRFHLGFLPCLLLCLATVTGGCGGTNSTNADIKDPDTELAERVQSETIRQDNSRAFRVSWDASGYLSTYTALEYHIYRSTKFAKYEPQVDISELVGVVPAGENSFVDIKDARTLTFRTVNGIWDEERTLEMKSVTAQGVKQDGTPYYYRVTVVIQDDREPPAFGRYAEFWVGGYGNPYPSFGDGS